MFADWWWEFYGMELWESNNFLPQVVDRTEVASFAILQQQEWGTGHGHALSGISAFGLHWL